MNDSRSRPATLRDILAQSRLLLAESLIGLAVKVAPRGHPDSAKIYAAALNIAHDDD